jgi:hypothetical protein
MEQGNGAWVQFVERLRREVYAKDMKVMLFSVLLLLALGLAGLFGYSLRMRPDQRAVAEAEANMAFKCFMTSERVQLERDLQSIRDLDEGKPDEVRQRANHRIDAWVMRRFGDSRARPYQQEENDGWMIGFLADVARQRASHPYAGSGPQAGPAVGEILKRALTLEEQTDGK